MTKVFTIGFTRKSAEAFFRILKEKGVGRVIDVRLNNVSQLAGFTKRDDLRYFLRAIGGIDYEHLPVLAPTAELMDCYKTKRITRAQFEERFMKLLQERKAENAVHPERLNSCCFLCSEASAESCHRRLVADYFKTITPGLEIEHL